LTGARSLSFLLPGDLNTRTGGYGYDREIIAGLRALGWHVDIRPLDASFPYPTESALQSARAVLSSIPDDALVIIDGLALGAMPDLAEAEGRRLKLIGLVHHPLALETGLDERRVLAFRDSERRSLANARGVIVTSLATQRALRDYSVPAGRISVIEPGTAAAPLALGSGSRTLALLCVASLTARKGHDVLFAALAGLREYDWHLTCVGGAMGNAGTLPRMRAELDANEIGHRVTFAGEGDDELVGQAYGAADVFVLPTRYEGYGMVVAEALARGLPVISTRTGAIPELVGERAGIIVSPGDSNALQTALRRLFDEPGLLNSLRQGAVCARAGLPRWQDAAKKLSVVLDGIAAP
jgi:glycosyltransferase involved in cell wall biosynthesis